MTNVKQGINSDGLEMSSAYVEHDRVCIVFDEPSLVRQEFADECDVNNLMARYEKTGVINHWNKNAPAYLDLTDMPDTLQGTLEMMRAAETAFMTLPAIVRRDFENSPEQFVEFASDPGNLEQMREWGLAKPKEAPPPPQKVEIVNPAPAPAPLPGGGPEAPK